jgi:hypothetical protein
MEGVSHFIADRQKISSFVISIAIKGRKRKPFRNAVGNVILDGSF